MSRLIFTLDAWSISIALILVTIIITFCAQAIFKTLLKTQKYPVLQRLAPSIFNILYIIGIKIAVDFAPIYGQFEATIRGGIYIIAIVTFLYFLRQVALMTLEWSTLQVSNSVTFRQSFIPLLKNLITLFIFFTGVISILKYFNYDVMSLVTALGVGSLAIGLASKDTLSNMISGFILIVDRNLRPGDRINLSGIIGDVHEIGLRSTQILVTDGNTLIVPNSELVNTRILNLSLPVRNAICTAWLRISYEVSLSKVRNLSLSVLNQLDKISSEKPKAVHLVNVSEGYQLIQIIFWVSELNDVGPVLSNFYEQLLEHLDKEHIPLLPPIFHPPALH